MTFNPAVCSAEIVEESGSLLEFLAGTEDDCAYDNWVSLISEGIGDSGYNCYAPPEIDRQTNGFGTYQVIDSLGNPEEILDDWYAIFANITVGNVDEALAILEDSDFAEVYEIVCLEDGDKTYLMLREVLNDEYFDDNGTEDESDDVTGSFDYGWGLYVFDMDAISPNVLIEIPHPNDDYISPYIGIDAFFTIGARAIFISGTGREVIWNDDGNGYRNHKSLSDPTRRNISVFQKAHEAVVDSLANELVIQIHSYDSESHLDCLPNLVSAWPDNYPNPPIMDYDQHLDMLGLTPLYPIPANSLGNEDHDSVRIDDYYCVWYEGEDYFYEEDILISPEGIVGLRGYIDSPQKIYSHAGHDTLEDDEPWLHVEHDEFPNVINEDILEFYPVGGVPTYQTYGNVVQFYRPMYQALHDYFHRNSLHNVPDDYETIQAAIDASFDGDTVLVHPGEYVENIDFCGKAIVVIGNPDDPSEVIIDGDENGSVVRFANEEDANSVLSGFTLTNGTGSSDLMGDRCGGGIICLISSPTLTHLKITENVARFGGGIFVQYSSPKVSYVSITNNQAYTSGGGLYCSRETDVEISFTLICGNSARNYGSGVDCFTSAHCLFTNVAIINNTGGAGGFATIACDDVEIINSILWGNNGCQIFNGVANQDTLIISHTNIEGGEEGIETNNNCEIIWLEGNIDEDPQFVNPDEGDFHLTEDSPCIDTGTAFFVWEGDTLINLSEEQYIGDAPDMGAFEYDPQGVDPEGITPPVDYVLMNVYPNPFNSTTTISYTLRVASQLILQLYDLSGRSVITLFEGFQQAGFHSANLTASDLPSGLYFVRLVASEQTLTRKIMLIK
ncbi:MAG: T9SS type A sorting domain-containing protein [Candidatus Electryoneaceae bacterium]|nr:T9SS type A sorting domain-containing protein [Candidatus Electryoneaceae bacterium]